MSKHLENGFAIHESPTPCSTIVFFDISKKALSLICTIFEHGCEKLVDDNILGFLLNLNPALGIFSPKLDVCSFLAQKIRE